MVYFVAHDFWTCNSCDDGFVCGERDGELFFLECYECGWHSHVTPEDIEELRQKITEELSSTAQWAE
jgi:Zn ribbon nucleic-acid-binding protein